MSALTGCSDGAVVGKCPAVEERTVHAARAARGDVGRYGASVSEVGGCRRREDFVKFVKGDGKPPCID